MSATTLKRKSDAEVPKGRDNSAQGNALGNANLSVSALKGRDNMEPSFCVALSGLAICLPHTQGVALGCAVSGRWPVALEFGLKRVSLQYWRLFALAGLAVMMVEWWWFHRRTA